MNALYWREPLWAALGLLPLLWLVLGRWRASRLRHQYADPALWPWALGNSHPAGSPWRRAALLLAWLLLGLAAAGPRLPDALPPDLDRQQATLMVVLDLSRSMDAEDVWPSRRRLALRALQGLLPELAASRVGLVVVAGRAHRLWPASADRRALAELVGQLQDLRPPSQGSALAEGVTLALQDLAGPGERQLLLLTDGDLDEPARQVLATALGQASAAGVGVLIAGTGTIGGAALPGPGGDWLRQDGEPVLSRLAEAQLQQLADASGADYLTLPEQAPDQALLDRLPTGLSHLRLAADAPVLWHELFPWLLWPALLLWLLGVLRLPSPAAPAGLAATALYLVGLTLALPAHADPLRQAHQALAADDLGRAQALFDELPGYTARMGSGTVCHRLQDWGCARQAFAQAALAAPDDDARAKAIYNLAHSVFQDGDFAGAATLFDDALRYRADYPAARHNRDFAVALAAEVERLAGGPQAERRASRGPASGPAGDAQPPKDARLTLDTHTPGTGLALSAAQRQDLINQGLAYTRLAETRQADANAPWGQVYGGAGSKGVADVSLWQGLLERAEGLPTTPAEPLTLPGVRPW